MFSKKKSDAAQAKARENGKFVKGVSGNPAGRPKKKVDEKDLPKDFHTEAGADAKKALESLLSSATTRYEAHKIAKDLLPYQSPKLSNVESYATEIKTIEIKWLSDMPEPVKTIEGEIEKIVNVEEE